MREERHEDWYLIIGAAVMIAGPLLLGGYIYYFFTISYAQTSAVQASQNWSHVVDVKPGQNR